MEEKKTTSADEELEGESTESVDEEAEEVDNEESEG